MHSFSSGLVRSAEFDTVKPQFRFLRLEPFTLKSIHRYLEISIDIAATILISRDRDYRQTAPSPRQRPANRLRSLVPPAADRRGALRQWVHLN